MNVKELKEFLDKFPEDMEILYQIHSDYRKLESDLINVDKAVDKGSYVMRPHETMSVENKFLQKDYLIFPGN